MAQEEGTSMKNDQQVAEPANTLKRHCASGHSETKLWADILVWQSRSLLNSEAAQSSAACGKGSSCCTTAIHHEAFRDRLAVPTGARSHKICAEHNGARERQWRSQGQGYWIWGDGVGPAVAMQVILYLPICWHGYLWHTLHRSEYIHCTGRGLLSRTAATSPIGCSADCAGPAELSRGQRKALIRLWYQEVENRLLGGRAQSIPACCFPSSPSSAFLPSGV